MTLDTFRLIASGDWHLSNTLPHATPDLDGVTDRLRHVLDVFDQMRAYAEEVHADAIALLGDIFDKSRPDPIALRLGVGAMVACAPRRVWILDGNHDAQSLKGGHFVTEVFGAMAHDHLLHMKIGEPIRPRTWLEFQPIPYAPVKTTAERLLDLRVDRDPSVQRVAFFHQGILGCGHQGWICDDGIDGEEATQGFDLFLSGHFHTTQEFGDCGMYLGAPLQHHFGDAGDAKRGWWDITFTAGEKPKRKHVLSKAPKFWTHEIDFADTASIRKARKAIEFEAQAGDFVRIDVKCTHAELGVLRPKIDLFLEQMRARKLNIRDAHKPVYHHDRRIDLDTDGEAEDVLKNAIGAYLDGPADTSGLDDDRLRAIGHEALAAAE